jgi:hypothetical protein
MPDFGPRRQKAVQFAVGERRIGEQRGDHRLQRQTDAQLGDHVGLVGKIEVDLHGRGAKHHVEPARPHFRHVARHDAIAALRHGRGLGERPFRADAESEEADPERIGDAVGAPQIRVEFARDSVDARQRRAGELELAARFERNRRAALRVEQADELAVVLDAPPAQAFAQALQQRPNPAWAFIGNRRQIGLGEGEFLVFHADATRLGGFAARFHPGDQIVAGLNDLGVDDVAGHAGFRGNGPDERRAPR